MYVWIVFIGDKVIDVFFTKADAQQQVTALDTPLARCKRYTVWGGKKATDGATP